MNCTKCGGPLRVTHTYQAGQFVKTQTRKCRGCGAVFTSAVILMREVTEYREGAFALAQRLRDKHFKLTEE